MQINIYNQNAEKVGEQKLSDKVFNVKTNEGLVHQAMVAQMSNERQVLAHTKGRGEVRGGGKKPWKQKGTGRARAGSSRSPIWIHGGVTFGPTKDRNFKKDINKKMKQKALLMVLSDKVVNENLIILDKLEMKEYKTKVLDEMLKVLNNRQQIADNRKQIADSREGGMESKQQEDKTIKQSEKNIKLQKRSVLVINERKDEKIKYSGRNLQGVEIINLENINILDLLKYRDLVLTVSGVKKLEQIYD